MISERISDNIPPQMKILNTVISYPHSNAQVAFLVKNDRENVVYVAPTSSGCQLHKTARKLHIFTFQPMKSDVT